MPKKAADELKTFTEIFSYAQDTPLLKNFILDNVDLINELPLALGSFKNTSEHAGAVILTPTEDEQGNPMEIYDWLPVKKNSDGVLVSEYTGNELDSLGFLKNDFLGLGQLDKVKNILSFIKKDKEVDIEIENIPLDDEKTYWMFQEGYTQDVFQFNGSGITGFLMDLRPDNIEHLISANALYRPGAMSSDFDKEYVKLRHGFKLPDYIKGTEETLKSTYGLLIYQESTMSLVVDYAGFSMSEADDLRKAVGKKRADLMQEQRQKFFDGAKALGRDTEDTSNLWDMIERTAEYQFNRSHSAAYTMLSYSTMYLKTHYPLQFYTAALQFADDDNKPKIISEMNNLGEVKVAQPDINSSFDGFKPDKDKNKIYWSLASIKWVGDKAVERIIEEREKNGNFYSVKDLFDRVDKRTVNKRAVTNLILAGAFDEVYDIKRSSERIKILREYYEEILKEDLPKEYVGQYRDYWWELKSIELSGLGYVNYKDIVASSSFAAKASMLANPIKFQQEESIDSEVIVAGIVSKVTERNSKRGKFLSMEVDFNSELFHITIWNDTYEKYKPELKNSEKSIILINGNVRYDGWKKQNVLHTIDKTKVEII